MNIKNGFSFVAATLGISCDNDVNRIEPGVCDQLNPGDTGECCPTTYGNDQEYCWGGEDDYCDSGECFCKILPAEPQQLGEFYGVAPCKGYNCGGLESLSCRGTIWKGICYKGFGPYHINKDGLIYEQTNVFVKEKFSWILTKKGELITAKVVITIW